MKVMVTGAAGYIGRHVVKMALEMGHEVIASDFHFDGVDERAERCQVPIFSGAENIFEQVGKPDVCIHMAWRNGFIHNSPTHMADLSSHIDFCWNMMKGGLAHLSVMGSMHEIGYWEGAIDENTPCNPLTQYGIAKNAMRQSLLLRAKETGCHLKWLRAYYITGDDAHSNSIFAKIEKAAEEGKTVFPFTSGKNYYDFVDVDDLAKMIVAASVQKKIDGIINVCSGKPVTLAERVERFIHEEGLNIRLEYGAFPDRPYDSPGIWGDAQKITMIMDELHSGQSDAE